VSELKIRERPPSTNKKMSTAGPREVPELKIQERPSSTLRNEDGEPSGGSGVGDLGAPTITVTNIDNGPRAVPELKIHKHPPSMLRNVGGRPREVLELVI
jgi:hypothetical protein